MNEKQEATSQTNDGIADLPEITFGETEIGRSYLTPAGHQIEVIEVVPKSHAIIMTSKGKEMKILAEKNCRGPLPRKVDVEEARKPTQPAEKHKSEATRTNNVRVSTRGKRDMQVLPFGLLRETTRLLDTAVTAAGIKNRSTFIRVALIEKLRAIGGADAEAAANALATETNV